MQLKAAATWAPRRESAARPARSSRASMSWRVQGTAIAFGTTTGELQLPDCCRWVTGQPAPQAKRAVQGCMSYRILVVESSPSVAVAAHRALTCAQHRVATVHTFEQATRQIALDCPDLVVTAIRLGAFNGLHLLLRVRAEHDDLPVVVLGDPVDATSDIDRYHGCFVSVPLETPALVSAVSRLLENRQPRDPRNERRWPRKIAALAATVDACEARVTELSYGGLRLEMTQAPTEQAGPVDIRFPSLGLSITALVRWAKPLEGGAAWYYGAEVAIPGSDDSSTWRWIVDSLN